MSFDLERERLEAIEAGERALQSLYRAQDELNGARNWGILDIIGGGLISSIVKHSKMDKAQQYMEQAKFDLHNFSRELQDVNAYYDLNVDTGDFLRFADWFFDGFVADFLVQSRINEARSQVEQAIRMVQDIVTDLRLG